MLVSIWTPHISKAESSSPTLQAASLVTSIFPERDDSCYFMVQEQSDEGVLCKTPLGYRDGKQLDGLLTLKNYVDGGHEVPSCKVLVCVKSIGARKTCKRSLPSRVIHSGHMHAHCLLQLRPRKATRQKRSMSTSSTIQLMHYLPCGAVQLHLHRTGKPRRRSF